MATTGTGEQHYALIPPGWSGLLPGGVAALAAPTPTVWIIGRTQTNGPADYAAVHQVQAGFAATPLTRWGQPSAPPPPSFEADPAVDMTTPPLEQVEAMPATGFFTLAAELLKAHPPHPTDSSVLNRIARVGRARRQPARGRHLPAPRRRRRRRAGERGSRLPVLTCTISNIGADAG